MKKQERLARQAESERLGQSFIKMVDGLMTSEWQQTDARVTHEFAVAQFDNKNGRVLIAATGRELLMFSARLAELAQVRAKQAIQEFNRIMGVPA